MFMEQLISRLNQIPNAYFEFVDSMVDYAEIKESHFTLLMEFLDNNPSATPSDIIKFVSFQPDFFDNSVPEDMDDVLIG